MPRLQGRTIPSMTDTDPRDHGYPTRWSSAFRVFLRVYGVLTLAIFILLLVGFVVQTPLLAEHGGPLNWTIWNDIRCGSEHMHVPPMLMVIYIVWGCFCCGRREIHTDTCRF
jgi:hypothetical protein